MVWDNDRKVEHFIRSATFQGQAKDFGFILPTPNPPKEIEVADESAFGVLENLQPRPTTGDMAKGEAAAGGGVAVLEQKRVGDFEVSVLKAKDGAAIGDWLKQNGHKMRPAMEPWLQHYAERGWVLVAFKYVATKVSAGTKAVRVSFEAPGPFYPYKMPSDTWSEGHHRKLSLFVVSDSPVKGVYTDNRDWETAEDWNSKIPAPQVALLAGFLGTRKGPLELPANLVVTRFENVEGASHYEHDLVFEPNNPPFWALWLGLGALGSAGYAFIRRSRVLKEEQA